MISRTFVIMIATATLGEACYNISFIPTIINAMGKATNFFQEEFEKVNIDGVFGSLLAAISLREAQKALIFRNQLENLDWSLTRFISRTKPKLKKEPFKYQIFNKFLLDETLWKRFNTHGQFKLNKNPKIYNGPYNVETIDGFTNYMDESNYFNESISDDCLIEILTAGNEKVSHECPVSDICKNFMMPEIEEFQAGYIGYGATHRLLFQQVARSVNCDFNPYETRRLVEKYCSYIYWEFTQYKRFKYKPYLLDLGLEQVVLCGALEGFPEFFQEEFLIYILKNQQSEGCYGLNVSKRRKRETVVMKHFCDSHTTGLAIAAYGAYLEHIVKNLCLYE